MKLTTNEAILRVVFFIGWLMCIPVGSANDKIDEHTNWLSLTGEQIKAALESQRVHYPQEGGAVQEFHTNGTTVYIENGPSFGSWRTSDTQYCSVWPPASSWVCYDVLISEDRSSIRFIDGSGRIYHGKFAPE